MTTPSIPVTIMRGGTSRGVFVLARDLPSNPAERDSTLLRIMGSPHPRQVDGIGGAHLLTSKVAVVSESCSADADVDYHFFQIGVTDRTVTDQQNCGNILAAVGQFAIERALISASSEFTSVRIRMVNSDTVAVATFPTPGGVVDYAGDTTISGVKGEAARVTIEFADTEGSFCGSLLPTGLAHETIDDVPVTLIDNGMPVIIAGMDSFGLRGTESPKDLEDDTWLTEKLASLRREGAHRMGLEGKPSVPKISLIGPPLAGGALTTRTFIPVRCHDSIGVFVAITIARATKIPGSVAERPLGNENAMRIEHPTGFLDVGTGSQSDGVSRATVVRTARKLMEGRVFL